jgi:CubicO group peptidase (beta-lactamase class C family)
MTRRLPRLQALERAFFWLLFAAFPALLLAAAPAQPESTLQAVPRPAEFALPRLSEGEALAGLEARVEELAKKDEFSSAVLVARHGKVLLQQAWGRADREAGTPVTVDTQCRLGSMNKMFTAVATLQLVEAGKLALDDTIGKHLTDYPNKDVASKVTVRHLLTHTGGTGDIFGPDFTKNRLSLRAHGDYLKLYRSRALTHEPGAEQRYSNYGFVLLGALIEKASGGIRSANQSTRRVAVGRRPSASPSNRAGVPYPRGRCATSSSLSS